MPLVLPEQFLYRTGITLLYSQPVKGAVEDMINFEIKFQYKNETLLLGMVLKWKSNGISTNGADHCYGNNTPVENYSAKRYDEIIVMRLYVKSAANG